MSVPIHRDAIWCRLIVRISTMPLGETVTEVFIIRPRP